MRSYAFLLLFSVVYSFTMTAQSNSDHLVPSRDIWGVFEYQVDYYSNVRKSLFRNLSDRPEVRLVIMPSFTPESVLAIQEEDGGYNLIYRMVNRRIWGTSTSDQIEFTEYKVAIDVRSVQIIKSLFLKAVKQTKYPDEDVMGLDGVNYYFYVWDYGLKSGMVWTPQTSKMKRLVEVGEALIDLAKEGNEVVVFDSSFLEKMMLLESDLEK